MSATKRHRLRRRTRFNGWPYIEHEGWDCDPVDADRASRAALLGFVVVLGVVLASWLMSNVSDSHIDRRLPPVLRQ